VEDHLEATGWDYDCVRQAGKQNRQYRANRSRDFTERFYPIAPKFLD
jgi:hypothetical protein